MFTTKSSRIVRVAASAAVCVTLALGTAGVALAGQGSHDRGHSISSHNHGQHSNDPSGTVTGFTPTSITLSRHGTSTTYMTTGTTTYAEGKTPGAYTDLANGEFVRLELTPTTPQTVTAVTICLVHFFGTVTGSVVDNVITLTSFHGTTLTVTVSGTTTYTMGGAPSTIAAVVSGAKISAVGLPGTTAGSLNANSVNIFVSSGTGHGHGHGHGHSHGHSFGHSRH